MPKQGLKGLLSADQDALFALQPVPGSVQAPGYPHQNS